MPKAKEKTDQPTSDEENDQKEQGRPGGDAGPSKAWALAQALRTCAAREDIPWCDSLHKAVSITSLFDGSAVKRTQGLVDQFFLVIF